MGKIILTVEGSTVGTVATGGGIVIERAVSETDSARLIAAFAKIYAGRWTTEDGQPRAPTMTEILTTWFDEVIRGAVVTVREREQIDAAAAAAATVTPIEVTST